MAAKKNPFRPKTSLPRVQIQVRAGKPYYYYRRTGHPLTALPTPNQVEYTRDPGFMAKWQSLENGAIAPTTKELLAGPKAGTIDALVARYKADDVFISLGDATKYQYRIFLGVIQEMWGDHKVATISRGDCFYLRNRYAVNWMVDRRNPKTGKTRAVALPVKDPLAQAAFKSLGSTRDERIGEILSLTEPRAIEVDGVAVNMTPHRRRANYLGTVLSLLLAFAADQDMIPASPAGQMRKLKEHGAGFAAWTKADFITFLQSSPSFEARQYVFLGLYVGQRIEDNVDLGWTNFDGHIFRFKQLKTGKEMAVPAHAELLEEMAHWPKKRVKRGRKAKENKVEYTNFILNRNGKPFTPNGMSQRLRKDLDKAGLGHLSSHGLRKLLTSHIIDGGGDPKSVTGHVTDSMVRLYDKAADQGKRATATIAAFQPIFKKPGGPEKKGK